MLGVVDRKWLLAERKNCSAGDSLSLHALWNVDQRSVWHGDIGEPTEKRGQRHSWSAGLLRVLRRRVIAVAPAQYSRLTSVPRFNDRSHDRAQVARRPGRSSTAPEFGNADCDGVGRFRRVGITAGVHPHRRGIGRVEPVPARDAEPELRPYLVRNVIIISFFVKNAGQLANIGRRLAERLVRRGAGLRLAPP